ncbi:MAG: hypothetical protein P8178_08040 [Candidatus Thiodiazotropha sp.]
MKGSAVSFLTILVVMPAFAENPAVEAANYAVSAALSNGDIGDSYGLSATARFPLVDYTGASVSGQYAEFKGADNYIDSSSRSAALGLFIRKFDLGIVSLDYSHTRSSPEGGFGLKDYNTNSLSLTGTYYLDRFDLSLGRTKFRGVGETLSASHLGVAYYLDDSFRLGAGYSSANGDHAKSLQFDYQPAVFGNAIGLSGGYTDTRDDDSISLSISYFFNTRVSLIDRTRRY